ncbi:MAG: hypothetical protein GYA55_05050, partial [SAR324 cluster bacterium]|nr:hypothetical protein [SAR324 cluster bacterium]
GKSFWRYGHRWDNVYLYYLPEKMKRENPRARPGETERFEVSEKIILYRFLSKNSGMIATLDRDQFYCLGSTYVVRNKKGDEFPLEVLLAILNSKLIAYFNKSHFQGVKVTLSELNRLPMVKLNKEDPAQCQTLAEIVALVNEKYRINTQAVTPQEISALSQRQMALEDRIDSLVYRIYDLDQISITAIETYFSSESAY